ncbi:MAG: SprT family zinc-dependent metalloprotease [Bacteroidales bacterium]|nr:SprT family zinc-dependent metalloprotease [Bacteroidales bacterium]
MKKYERITVKDIGSVWVSRSRTAHKVRIIIKPSGEVHLTIPYSVPVTRGIEFAEKKKDWILKHLENQQKQKQQTPHFLPGTGFNTRMHQVTIKSHTQNSFYYVIEHQVTQIFIPDSEPPESQQAQDWIKKALEETWRREAILMLPERVMKLSDVNNFPYPKTTIRNAKTRWGSCSSNGNINLSLYLMRLPDALIDFVILHELTHLIHPNHSEAFHAHLNSLCGGKEKVLNKWLRTFKMDDYRMYYAINTKNSNEEKQGNTIK